MAKAPERSYSAGYLVEQLQISDKYLRRLMTQLSKAGFVGSTRGREGGYTFKKPTNAIFLAEIVDSVEGMDKYLGCGLGFEHCSAGNPCIMHNTWATIREEFSKVFRNKSLADLSQETGNKF